MSVTVAPNYATEIADALWRSLRLRDARASTGLIGLVREYDDAIEQADNDLAAVLSNGRAEVTP
jgi:hypothetical protein